MNETNDVDDLMQEAEGKLFEISQRNLKKDVTQIDPVLSEAIRQIQIAANRSDGSSGLQTGFHDIDKISSGWKFRPHHYRRPSRYGKNGIRPFYGKEHGCQLQHAGGDPLARNVQCPACQSSHHQHL